MRVRVHHERGVGGVGESLRAAERAVRALGKRLGPYDSTELDVVLLRNARFTGMEYPELVFSVPVPDVVTHEVAHQWWYGLVGNNQAAEPWLDESFAQYSHERLHPFIEHLPSRPPSRVRASAPARRTARRGHGPLRARRARSNRRGGLPGWARARCRRWSAASAARA